MRGKDTPTRKEQGQSLILIALGMVTLIAFVGLAVDLGITYVERIKVRRAADAAALAAAAELPLEAAGHVRALEYLADNGFDCGLQVSTSGTGAAMRLQYTCTAPDIRVEINCDDNGVPLPGGFTTGPDASAARQILRVNTAKFRDNGVNTANKIQVSVTQKAQIYFMRVLGFVDIPVTGNATAENINNLDVVLGFDDSGSMEFDTYCYGCFVPSTYPSGNRYPLPWNGTGAGTSPVHCSGSGSPLLYKTNGVTYTYITIEAEEYSNTNNAYDPNMYTQGLTYWVLQRNGSQAPSYMGNAKALGRDTYGAYIEHHPYRVHVNADGQGSNCNATNLANNYMCYRDSWIEERNGPFPAPLVEYTFKVPTTGIWHVWVRGQGGDGANNIMWGIKTPAGAISILNDVSGFGDTGYSFNGANSGEWEWQDMGAPMSALTPNTIYTLLIWAGASDFALDRIIITNDGVNNPNSIAAGSTFDTYVLRNNYFDNNRSGLACNPCDARFGGYPGGNGTTSPVCNDPSIPEAYRDRRLDVLYSDEEPIRGSIEAAKRFIARLDPKFDQIGLVAYNSSAAISSELQCLRRLGATSCTPTVITNTIIKTLDGLHAGGSTNIGHAMKLGIDVLSTNNSHYGRPGAAHIMIIMTDGESNQGTTGMDAACDDQDYWPTNTGDSNRDKAKDCMVYYAMQARNNGIVIYGITLGQSADIELMQYVAELTGGFHRHAPRPDQLDAIFDELYKRIFLRLIE